MTISTSGPQSGQSSDPATAYERHARSCAEDDFWGQVKRTVGGQPLDQGQIDLIQQQMHDRLALRPEDVLLDLCCGNGALGAPWFAACQGGLGVDISETLIGVANRHFTLDGKIAYDCTDVLDFAETCAAPDRFTKAIIYGSIAYFPPDRFETLVATLRDRFAGLDRLVLGNVPDRARIGEFFGSRARPVGIEDDPNSAIGVWWSQADIAAMAERSGWTARFAMMPDAFYAQHYRFDAVLHREA